MNYNLFIKSSATGLNLLNLPGDKLSIVTDAYHKGEYEFTVQGKTHNWGKPKEIRIFKNAKGLNDEQIAEFCQYDAGWVWVFGGGHLISPQTLSKLGEEITGEVLGDTPFGSQGVNKAKERNDVFVDKRRLVQLKGIKSDKYNLSRLIKMCEEINHNWKFENSLSVGLLLRTIINHIPPIFNDEFKTFDNVIASYPGTRSFKESITTLNVFLRKIADGYTHNLVSKKDDLPTPMQVDFRQPLDLILSEIIKILS